MKIYATEAAITPVHKCIQHRMTRSGWLLTLQIVLLKTAQLNVILRPLVSSRMYHIKLNLDFYVSYIICLWPQENSYVFDTYIITVKARFG